MRGRTVVGHLRRYPWWYGVAIAWLVAILALPVVELDPLGAFRDDSPHAAAPSAGGPADGLLPDGSVTGSGSVTAPATGDTGAAPADEGATTTTVPTASKLVPPEVLDMIFEAIPPIVFPPLPEELRTLAAGLAPIASTGCSGVGLASLVVSVVAQAAEGVPLGRLLPYLTPVSAACASFPIPETHTVCAADEPLVIDLGGVMETPPILGLGIDQLDAMESLMADTFGVSVPRLAPELRTTLDCRVVGRGT